LPTVIGQEAVRRRLADALRGGRAAHACLFSGPPGIGKTAVALEFAALLLCSGNGPLPCGECEHCRLSVQLQHPDLHLVFPLPSKPKTSATREQASGDKGIDERDDASENEGPAVDSAEEFAERISRLTRALAEDRYAPVVLPKSKGKKDEAKEKVQRQVIYISQIRSLLHAAAFTPFQAKRKVFVIFHADSMNQEAQNALLKVLEEPPEEGHFLLITENEQALRATIRSRCQLVRMNPLPREVIAEALTSAGLSAESARAAAMLSGGSYAFARELAGGDLPALQERVIAFLRAAAQCDPLKLPEQAAEFMETDELPDDTTLGLLAVFLRDVALRRASGSGGTTTLTFAAFREKIEGVLEAYPQADLEQAARAVDDAAQRLDKGYTRDYVLYALAIRLNEALGPRTPSKRKTTTTQHARHT